jgi:hypothetical protein
MQFKKAVEDHKEGHNRSMLSCRSTAPHTHAIRHLPLSSNPKTRRRKKTKEKEDGEQGERNTPACAMSRN